jgi:hypothetical protein
MLGKWEEHPDFKHTRIPRKSNSQLFFSGVIYTEEEIQRLTCLPVLPRYTRILFVRLFDSLAADLRDRLGFR